MAIFTRFDIINTIGRKYLTTSGDNTANFSNDIEYSESHTDPQYTSGAKLYGDGYYFAMKTVTVRTASKIYDFRITDCTDLAYKSVFRQTDTNERSENSYYSGIRKMYVYTMANKEYTISARTAQEVLGDVRQFLNGMGIEQPEAEVDLVDDPMIQCAQKKGSNKS